MNTWDDWRKGIDLLGEEMTREAGGYLGRLLPEDSVLLLSGDLGSGKTTLVKGLAKEWEVEGEVGSPTYNVCLIYGGTRQLIHIDAYRLKGSEDMDGLLLEDLLEEPWTVVVEWPERGICSWMMDRAWHVHLERLEQGHHRAKLIVGE